MVRGVTAPAFAADAVPGHPPLALIGRMIDENGGFAGFPPQPRGAATRDEEDVLQVPAAIDRVDAAEIHRAQFALNLSESLVRVPGVLARDRQNQAQDLQISIRGFGARATFGVRGAACLTPGSVGVYRSTNNKVREAPMAEIRWLKDVDAALAEAKAARKPILLDFSAAPM